MHSSRPYLLSSLLIFAAFLLSITLLDSCANIIPPLGGPRDSLPPVAVSIEPADSSTNFKSQKIVFSFDEYVQLDPAQDLVLVSPTPKINPQIEARLKTVTVRIKDTLEPNTTYAIHFGNAIRDVNENNPVPNFHYIFSTGNYFDTLQLAGKVILAETGKTDSTLIAMLHRNAEDSAVLKENPRYYTRVDKSGNFRFTHLAPGTYYLYALKYEGGNKRYMSTSQVFAFAKDSVVPGKGNKPEILYAYAEPEPDKKPKSTPPKPVKKDEDEKQDRRLRFTTNLQNGQQDLLQPMTFLFTNPVKSFDSSKFKFTNAAFEPLPNYKLESDSTQTLYTLTYNWPADQEFRIITEKGMASDSTGKSILRNDTLSFKTMKESDYGSIRFRFSNIDTALQPLLQFVENDKVSFSYPIKGPVLVINRCRPAEFELRILFDENHNGKWDSGKFFGQRKQPEHVQLINKKLRVKGNWDNEIDIAL